MDQSLRPVCTSPSRRQLGNCKDIDPPSLQRGASDSAVLQSQNTRPCLLTRGPCHSRGPRKEGIHTGHYPARANHLGPSLRASAATRSSLCMKLRLALCRVCTPASTSRNREACPGDASVCRSCAGASQPRRRRGGSCRRWCSPGAPGRWRSHRRAVAPRTPRRWRTTGPGGSCWRAPERGPPADRRQRDGFP